MKIENRPFSIGHSPKGENMKSIVGSGRTAGSGFFVGLNAMNEKRYNEIVKKEYQEAIKKISGMSLIEQLEYKKDLKEELLETRKVKEKINDEQTEQQRTFHGRVEDLKELCENKKKIQRIAIQMKWNELKMYHYKIEPVEERALKLELNLRACQNCIDNHLHSKSEPEKKIEEKQLKRKKIIPKVLLMQIYNEYLPFYERARIKYGNSLGTGYGADKQALKDTVNEIWAKEKVNVSPRNLKEALNRRIDRRPSNLGKE